MVKDLYKHKRSLELNWQQEYNEHGKYTLNMVQIDKKVQEVISSIKTEESKIADRHNKIAEAAPSVSIAT